MVHTHTHTQRMVKSVTVRSWSVSLDMGCHISLIWKRKENMFRFRSSCDHPPIDCGVCVCVYYTHTYTTAVDLAPPGELEREILCLILYAFAINFKTR
jgi:hypothetical protein